MMGRFGIRLIVALLLLLPAGSLQATVPGVEKTLILGVVDAAGKPVKNLTSDLLRMREDRVDREILSVRPSAEPLQVVLLVDTTRAVVDLTQDMRSALGGFVRYIHQNARDAQIELMEFGNAATITTKFSSDDVVLQKGIDTMVGREDAGGVLLEGIVRASEELSRRDSPRRVIVIFNTEPSDEQSRLQPKLILEALRTSVAQLYAVSLQRGALNNAKRDVVLQQLTKASGGTREFIYDQAAIGKVLNGFADAFTFQYEVTFSRPNDRRPSEVQVGTLAQGVTLHASGFPPQ